MVVKIKVKAHVRQYLAAAYGEPFKAKAAKLAYPGLLACMANTLPGPPPDGPGYEWLRVDVPNAYAARGFDLAEAAKMLETIFWEAAQREARDPAVKSRNISRFLARYEIPDGAIQEDSVRRRLTRMAVPSRPAVELEKRAFRCVDNDTAIEIARRRDRGYSLRELGRAYGLSHNTIDRIHKRFGKNRRFSVPKSDSF